MKIPRIILAAALALAAFTHLAAAGFPAPLPEFKNEQELAQWRAELNQAAEAEETVQSAVFYTGKPLLEATGKYAFLFRSYDPELARWTSEDPSGFPDGANNHTYGKAPNSGFDALGLKWVFVGEGSSDSYSGVFSVPIDIDGTNSGSYSITGFSNQQATSLTLVISSTTTLDGWFQSANATASTSVTLNINETSGEVTMSGLTKDDATDSAWSIGRVNAAYNLGIEDGTNVVQGQLAFGHTYKSLSGSVSIGFSGAGLQVGVVIPTGVDWSRTPTLSFAVNKQNVE